MSNTLIVSHDAGGAFLLSKWCRDWENKCEFVYYLNGPAIDIFKNIIPDICNLENIDWKEVSRVITSTGWQTTFEVDAVKVAKNKGIYVVSYLDHWANYTSRFLIDGNLHLPNEIWVADNEAKLIAEKEFYNKPIEYRFIRNRHF